MSYFGLIFLSIYKLAALSRISTGIRGLNVGLSETLDRFFFVPLRPNAGHCLLIHEFSRSHTTKPKLVGLLLTSDQFVAETFTWVHYTKSRRGKSLYQCMSPNSFLGSPPPPPPTFTKSLSSVRILKNCSVVKTKRHFTSAFFMPVQPWSDVSMRAVTQVKDILSIRCELLWHIT